MVNLNNSTKMMVHRCMELLNAKIAHAQTRHIAKRVPLKRLIPRPLDATTLHRERQKAQRYEANKRLSMWDQSDDDKSNEATEGTRLDQSHYKHHTLKERKYGCTWVNFPEEYMAKPPKTCKIVENTVPVSRRSAGERPQTAKPFDDESKDFLSQWENSHVINRNRYAKYNHTSLTSMNRQAKLHDPREKAFYH